MQFIVFWLQAMTIKYVDFSGRARRKEFWSFYLVNIAINFGLLCAISSPRVGKVFAILVLLFHIAILLPSLAIMVRRLHDTNHSGWYLFFLSFIPFLGPLALLLFFLQAGDSGSNIYGNDPRMED